ncbi:MAG: ParB/RepB/Spo0J family partition protein [Candidatus Brennerbacteria bacterium]
MLGKGLESLLPKKSVAPSSAAPAPAPAVALRPLPPSSREEAYPRENVQKKPHQESIFQIEVEKIKPNPYQPRHTFKEEELDELAASIREFGVLQPLVVSKHVEETPHGAVVEYELIAGERRLLAAKRAGLPRVPAVVTQMDSRQMKLEVALIENIQRSDLSSLETARAYARLQEEFGLTQREIGLRVGKSREAVANTLRLLGLPSDALLALSEGKINESQARTLLSVEDLSARMRLFQEFLTGRATVRTFREKAGTAPASPEDIATVRALEEKLGTPVKVVRKSKGGTITISFYSDEEYRGVRAKLLGEEW